MGRRAVTFGCVASPQIWRRSHSSALPAPLNAYLGDSFAFRVPQAGAQWFARALSCEGVEARNLGSDEDDNVRAFWTGASCFAPQGPVSARWPVGWGTRGAGRSGPAGVAAGRMRRAVRALRGRLNWELYRHGPSAPEDLVDHRLVPQRQYDHR